LEKQQLEGVSKMSTKQMKDTPMLTEVKPNPYAGPYAGTPLARHMDDRLEKLDMMVKLHPLVTQPPLTQTALLSASGCVCAYSNHPLAGKAARYVPAIGVVLKQIDAALALAVGVKGDFGADLVLKLIRHRLVGMTTCDIAHGGV
jgi:hypothetical protein